MKSKKFLKVLLIIFLLFYGISIIKISTYETTYDLKKSDCILILGYSLDDDEPSSALVSRLESGLFLYKKGISGKIIVTGGRGPTDNIPVAVAMKNWLIKNGVSSNDILVEDMAKDTIDNFYYSKKICEDNDFSSTIIVTSDFHMYRSKIIAERFSFDAQEYFSRTQFDAEKLFNYIKEPFSLIKVYIWCLFGNIQS